MITMEFKYAKLGEQVVDGQLDVVCESSSAADGRLVIDARPALAIIGSVRVWLSPSEPSADGVVAVLTAEQPDATILGPKGEELFVSVPEDGILEVIESFPATCTINLSPRIQPKRRPWAATLPPGVLVRLDRSDCFGECAAYRLDVLRSGKIRLSHHRGIERDAFRERLDEEALAQLKAALERLHEFPDYAKPHYTDHPWLVVTYRRKGLVWRLVHAYADEWAKDALLDIEREIFDLVFRQK